MTMEVPASPTSPAGAARRRRNAAAPPTAPATRPGLPVARWRHAAPQLQSVGSQDLDHRPREQSVLGRHHGVAQLQRARADDDLLVAHPLRRNCAREDVGHGNPVDAAGIDRIVDDEVAPRIRLGHCQRRGQRWDHRAVDRQRPWHVANDACGVRPDVTTAVVDCCANRSSGRVNVPRCFPAAGNSGEWHSRRQRRAPLRRPRRQTGLDGWLKSTSNATSLAPSSVSRSSSSA